MIIHLSYREVGTWEGLIHFVDFIKCSIKFPWKYRQPNVASITVISPLIFVGGAKKYKWEIMHKASQVGDRNFYTEIKESKHVSSFFLFLYIYIYIIIYYISMELQVGKCRLSSWAEVEKPFFFFFLLFYLLMIFLLDYLISYSSFLLRTMLRQTSESQLNPIKS